MWAVYNSLKGWSLFDLSSREVQLLIQSMTPNEIKLIQICDSQKQIWEVLNKEQHAALFVSVAQNSAAYPKLNQRNSNSDVDTDFFVIKKPQKIIYPRMHQRVEIALKVVIDGHNQKFETTTIDLSEGGVYFTDTIPDWVAGYFILRIYHDGRTFQVICSLVEDQKDKKRVQIVSEDSDPHFLKYCGLLESLKAAAA